MTDLVATVPEVARKEKFFVSFYIFINLTNSDRSAETWLHKMKPQKYIYNTKKF